MTDARPELFASTNLVVSASVWLSFVDSLATPLASSVLPLAHKGLSVAYDSYYSLALLVVLVVIVWVIIVRIDSHEEATARGRKDRRRDRPGI